jgi:acyl transferase domain-containing protein
MNDPKQGKQDDLRKTLGRALAEVKRLRTKLEALEGSATEPIAIVGVGLRLPGGVVDLDSLYTLLVQGRDAVAPIPLERWDVDEFYDPNPETPGKSYVREAGLLEHIDRFDASFFNITPREALSIDPQHRLLLEGAWEALESAGVVPGSLVDSQTGVFVGIGPSDYASLMGDAGDNPHAVLGTHMSFAAGRIAFTLGLQGPAISVDTACSSSLVALHLACSSLRARECELAIAAGVQVIAAPGAFIQLSRLRAVAPDGRCKTFSAKADGYGRGEGVVVLALERLDHARAKGRQPLAIIRGTAVNHDGRSSGITTPNGTSQQKVLRAALANAGLEPHEVQVIECHGTGTSLGDPIEVRALANVYADRPRKERLLLGAIKTNIGHLESAAGLAGVAKILAALQHDTLPATLHSTPPNPYIEWDSLSVEVLSEQRSWPRSEQPRRGGVSGFGLSGTNAHVIIEEPPLPDADRAPTAQLFWVPLAVSGRSVQALRDQVARLCAWLGRSNDQTGPLELGAALAVARTHFEYRAVAIVELSKSAHDALAALELEHVAPTVAPKLAVLFTGQGAQRPGAGRDLYERFEVLRNSVDELCRRFDAELSHPLLPIMHAAPGSDAAALLDRTEFTQPAVFVLEVALYRLFESWGVRAKLLLGHSIGEVVAAHIAGVLNLDDACTLVAARAKLMGALPQGGVMWSIQANESEVVAALSEHRHAVGIAGLNGPMSSVISGDDATAAAIAETFAKRGRKTKRLTVSHAFHSHHMQPMLAEFEQRIAKLEFGVARIPIASNVTGELIGAEHATPAYWVRHVREAVRFFDGVRTLEAQGATAMLEIGPDGVLSAMAAGCLSDEAQARPLSLISTLSKASPELFAVVNALARLHVHGVKLDWGAVFGLAVPPRVKLPTYPFQRERVWLPAGQRARAAVTLAGRYELSGQRTELPRGGFLHVVPIGPAIQHYLGDHIVYDTIVVPGAFYLAVLLAVAESHWPGQAIELRDVEFIRALSFDGPNREVLLYVQLEAIDGDPDRYAVSVLTRDTEGGWTTHANAVMGVDDAPVPAMSLGTDAHDWVDDTEQLDERLRTVNIDWGSQWWWLRERAVVDGVTILGRFEPQPNVPTADAPVPGGLIDNSFALMSWAANNEVISNGTPQLPFGARRVRWFGSEGLPTHARLDVGEVTASSSKGDIGYYSRSGALLAVIEGFVARLAPIERFLSRRTSRDLYVVDWVAELETGKSATKITVLGDDLFELTKLPEFGVRSPNLAAIDAERHTVIVTCGGGTPLVASLAVFDTLQTWLLANELAEHRLVFVTRNAVEVRSEPGPLDLAMAPIWGLVRSAMREYPDRDIRLIDVDSGSNAAAGLHQALGFDEPQLAVRGNSILAPRLARSEAAEPLTPLDPDATVLITGGTGGLGAMLAKHLVEHHAVRHLLLLSRRGSSVPEARALLEMLEAAGARVQLLACDITDRSELGRALALVPAEHPVRAIFHTAGVIEDAMLPSLNAASFASVFAPKVEGSHNLHELSESLSLTHFVLFSSLTGVIGAAGQANYAAANTYVDALCAYRKGRGLPATSLAWGPWADGGMAARLSATDRARMERQGAPPLTTEQGLTLLDAALAQPTALLVPARFDTRLLANRTDQMPMLRGLADGAVRRRGKPRAAGLRQQLVGLSEVEQLHELEELLGREAATILGWADGSSLAREQSLQEVGLDSLMAVELRNRLQTLTGLRLPSTLLFDHPSIMALALMLRGLVGEVPVGDSSSSPEPSTEYGAQDAITQSLQSMFSGVGKPNNDADTNWLAVLLRDSIARGEGAIAVRMLLTLAELRRGSSSSQHQQSSPVLLRRTDRVAPRAIQFFCIPSIATPSTFLQFVKLAPKLARLGDVWSNDNAGYGVGEALAKSIDDIVQHHISAIKKCRVADSLFVVVGYSSGGWVSLQVAHQLEMEGIAANAHVMLDSIMPIGAGITELTLPFIFRTLDMQIQGVTPQTGAELVWQLSSMATGFSLFLEQWEIPRISTPTLFVGAERGVVLSLGGEGPVFRTEPRQWEAMLNEMTIRSVSSDHFALIGPDVDLVAEAVLTWVEPTLGT